MSLLGSTVANDVGLRLLLCPLGSNVVIRTACCSIGIVLPVYNTFKAIENKDQNEQQKWLYYWAAYGSFSIAEIFADKILSWCPLYYHLKFAFLVWLQLPSADACRHLPSPDPALSGSLVHWGAKYLYMNHLRPFLLRHQARLDQVGGFAYGEMAKFISAHQAEFQFMRALVMKIAGSATEMMRDIIHPVPPRQHRAIAAPPRQNQDAESNHDDM